MWKAKAKAEAERKKPGRKASGLRDLPPEAARYAVNEAMVDAVRDAIGLQKAASRIGVSNGGVPGLARMLQGDLAVSALAVAEGGRISMRPVLRSTAYERQLRVAGVPGRLLFVAKAFVGDMEGATIGKLTASYGEGLGGGTASEPERLLIAMDRLVRGQEGLNRSERFTLWSALVFGLPLVDIGYALYGDRITERVRLVERASLHLECALERMEPHYLARG